MRVNTVDFTAGSCKVHVPLGQKRTCVPINHNNKLRRSDIIPITGLIGASLMSIYLIKKGNLDIGMRAIHI